MADQYSTLDRLIEAAIEAGKNPLYERDVSREAERLAVAMEREGFRVIDARLTALKKVGRIVFLTKPQAASRGVHAGWSLVGNANPMSSTLLEARG